MLLCLNGLCGLFSLPHRDVLITLAVLCEGLVGDVGPQAPWSGLVVLLDMDGVFRPPQARVQTSPQTSPPPAEQLGGVTSHADQVQLCRKQASLFGLFHSTTSAEADCVLPRVWVWPDI